jgi:dTDP-4-amino-4,6-dideoxygalactose transaminase
MNVPFLDFKTDYLRFKEEYDDAYYRVMESGRYILGEELELFEHKFANYCRTDYCIGVGNGLEALFLVLKSWNIGPGDEIIVPANTFIATWLAVTWTGAKPVPIEPDEKTYNITVQEVEKSLTSKTKVIIPVHLYGQPVDIKPINELATQFGLKVLEDAAQAHGAEFNHERTGGMADAAAFSFYPSKNLGAYGDGGAITTNDKRLADHLKLLRNYGSEKKYSHSIPGLNSRLDELQAAFLQTKLIHLDESNKIRKNIADQYKMSLKKSHLTLPFVHKLADPVWHQYVVRTKVREKIQAHLRNNSIETIIHYPIPPHLSAAYTNLGYKPGDFPISETLSNEIISLPIGTHLTSEMINYIIDSIIKFELMEVSNE